MEFISSMTVTYRRSRDALHPLMFLGPMLIYVYVFRPALLLASGDLQKFLSDEQILFAQMLFTLGIVFFCMGILFGSGRKRGRIRFELTPKMRPRLVRLGCILGTLAVSSYWFAIFYSGGFFRVYGRAKGYYSTGSGWINELVNLAIPAAALLLLAWQGQRRPASYPSIRSVASPR
ncbi:MAG: hypothetical protein IH998_07850 [Proteobacteria bacterium]|nr:hypothetical protein [Pseudomonadota bacterium]